MAFTLDEIDRYDRQILLPEWGAAGQERVRAAQVTVAGTGPAARAAIGYLAGAGIGRLMCEVPAAAHGINPHCVVDDARVPDEILLRLDAPPVAIAFNGMSVLARADREAEGAACAVEALKGILGLAYRSEVQLPPIEEVE